MSERKLLHAMGEINDRFIEEAAPISKKKRTWYWWVAAAACLVLVAGWITPPLLQGIRDTTGGNGRYKYTATVGAEAALVLRWEDKTLSERYTDMRFGGTQYRTRGLAMDVSLLGDQLGICDAWGYDHYTEQVYHQDFVAYEINGILEQKLVAVCMDGTYYVFLQDGYAPPATLGGLLETYDLAKNLPLSRFSHDDAYYVLEDDGYIWQVLTACSDAPVVDDDFRVTGKYISFTATSEALGIYKRVLYITADGYVKTNALDYGYVYFIGEEAAGRIIDYALSNAAETEMEPYANSVAGTITEIGDGYILINDAVLCWNEADGIEYKVLTTDSVFARWLKYYDFKVGDVVYVEYRGEVGENNVIDSAYTISDAVIQNGNVLIAE